MARLMIAASAVVMLSLVQGCTDDDNGPSTSDTADRLVSADNNVWPNNEYREIFDTLNRKCRETPDKLANLAIQSNARRKQFGDQPYSTWLILRDVIKATRSEGNKTICATFIQCNEYRDQLSHAESSAEGSKNTLNALQQRLGSSQLQRDSAIQAEISTWEGIRQKWEAEERRLQPIVTQQCGDKDPRF